MADAPAPAPAAAPAAAPPPAAAPSAPWYDGIDQETIGHWQNKGWKTDDPKALATEVTKAWKSLERHFGAPADQIVKLPKDSADEAGWKAVRERLGMPADPKGYDFSAVKFSDGTDVDAAFADAMRAALHKAGVAKDSAPEIVKAVVGHLDNADKAEATERAARLQADRAALAKEWGTNFEFNRLQAMQGAKRAAGNDEAAASLVAAMESAIGYSKTMEFWRKIGAGTTEDTFVDALNIGGNPTTRASAHARLADLQSDKAWVDRYLNNGAAERREFDNLMQMIHGAAA